MFPIVVLIVIVVLIPFIVFAIEKKNREQDWGDTEAGR
jgi:hypothetical protein